MIQCLYCRHRLFFKPFSDESFTCCLAHRETVEDINIRTGVSPAIERHGLKNAPCYRYKFGIGKSISNCSEDGNPFKVHPVKKDGERYLRNLLET